jgi:hypothetical protein
MHYWNVLELPLATLNTTVTNHEANETNPLSAFLKEAETTQTVAAGGTGIFSCCMIPASTHK